MSALPLEYPLTIEPTPGDGSAVEVSPGLMWLRMPLGGSLKFINVWAAREAHGWSVIDSGMHTPETIQAWRDALSGALKSGPVVRVLVTHMHPDHCGMAGWMFEQFGAPLWMSRLEYLMCRVMAADTGREAPAEGISFYQRAGWGEASIARYREKFGFFGRAISPLPSSYHRLSDGDRILVGGLEWQVVMGRGHSPEHACFHCAERKILISGDQVLPRISSNVSVFPTEPDADPLNDWLTSLAGLKQRVPNDVLVLPAHNSPFVGLHPRIDALIDSHQRGLVRLREMLTEPKRTVDVFPSLFSREITPDVLGMATGEAVAHLNYLWHRGDVTREEDAQHVWWWHQTQKPA